MLPPALGIAVSCRFVKRAPISVKLLLYCASTRSSAMLRSAPVPANAARCAAGPGANGDQCVLIVLDDLTPAFSLRRL